MNAPGPETCEVCGEGPMVRVLHPVAVHYKGSGFYSTDYGRKGRKPGGSGGESSSTSGSDSSDGSSGTGTEKTEKKAAEA
jgi:predicted nucleic acid-binding Zn ribbon protein